MLYELFTCVHICYQGLVCYICTLCMSYFTILAFSTAHSSLAFVVAPMAGRRRHAAWWQAEWWQEAQGQGWWQAEPLAQPHWWEAVPAAAWEGWQGDEMRAVAATAAAPDPSWARFAKGKAAPPRPAPKRPYGVPPLRHKKHSKVVKNYQRSCMAHMIKSRREALEEVGQFDIHAFVSAQPKATHWIIQLAERLLPPVAATAAGQAASTANVLYSLIAHFAETQFAVWTANFEEARTRLDPKTTTEVFQNAKHDMEMLNPEGWWGAAKTKRYYWENPPASSWGQALTFAPPPPAPAQAFAPPPPAPAQARAFAPAPAMPPRAPAFAPAPAAPAPAPAFAPAPAAARPAPAFAPAPAAARPAPALAPAPAPAPPAPALARAPAAAPRAPAFPPGSPEPPPPPPPQGLRRTLPRCGLCCLPILGFHDRALPP